MGTQCTIPHLGRCDRFDGFLISAHNVIAAVLKRLAHRNPNVQLYALSLAEALSKNCTIELHREIASRSFTQGLEKIITDRVRPLGL
jgi:signal transducing adaptor molecule